MRRYGHLTWEWAAGLRTYAHPALFGLAYWLLKLLHLDWPVAVIKAPGVVQAGFAALADVHVYKLGRLLFGEGPARRALPAAGVAACRRASPPRTRATQGCARCTGAGGLCSASWRAGSTFTA